MNEKQRQVQRRLEAKGWFIEWRGIPSSPWLWASKAEGPERGINMEIVDGRVTSFRGNATVQWIIDSVVEIREACRGLD